MTRGGESVDPAGVRKPTFTISCNALASNGKPMAWKWSACLVSGYLQRVHTHVDATWTVCP